MGSSEVKGRNLATLKKFGLNLKKFGRAITITATGYAQPTTGGAKGDAALSLQRAKEVVKILRQLGIQTTIVASGAGRTKVNSASSRYVEIVAKNRK